MVRQKKRYIIVELRDRRRELAYVQLRGREPEEALLRAVEDKHGLFGAAVVQPFVVSFVSEECGLLLVRMPHYSHKLLLSAVCGITNVGGVPTAAKVVAVAATPRVAYTHLLNYNESALELYKKRQAEYLKSRDSIVDSSSDEEMSML